MKGAGSLIPRVDGPLKTIGVADYASDHHFTGMLYAMPVGATITKRTLTRIDGGGAEGTPGVAKVYHRANRPPVYRPVPSQGSEYQSDEPRPPFGDDEIHYHGQYVAHVVAETFEQAIAGARAVKATYRAENPNVQAEMKFETAAKT